MAKKKKSSGPAASRTKKSDASGAGKSAAEKPATQSASATPGRKKAAKSAAKKVAATRPAGAHLTKIRKGAKKSTGKSSKKSPAPKAARSPKSAAGKKKSDPLKTFPRPERNKAELRERALRLSNTLRALYGHQGTALHFENAFQLLVATVLSAQATDDQVNRATPALFKACPTPEALASAPTEKIEELVRTTGFFRQKAKSIQSLARDLVERYGGEVPVEMEELTTLRGVGRKTANCVRGMAFGKPAVIVDTHFKRLAQRMAIVTTGDPDKIEFEIHNLLPEDHWTAFSNSLIWHGRAICTARAPRCPECPVLADCPTGQKLTTSGYFG